MLSTFEAMLKEEWRMHSLLFGNKNFSFFPVIVLVLSFIGSMMLPFYLLLMSLTQMMSVIHLAFLFFGLSVGGFGFLGQEALNRRLGDISLIAYASRTLPISERRLFVNFVLKDTLFYVMFLVVPFIIASSAASVIMGLPLDGLPYLAVSLTFTFLIGLSLSFGLSTLYAHLGKTSLAVVAAAAFLYTLKNPAWLSLEGISSLLPPLQYFLRRQTSNLLASLAIIAAFSGLSIIFLKIDYRFIAKRYADRYTGLTKRLGFGEYSTFIAKDILDISRSEGGLGKIVFSYAFPLLTLAVIMGFFRQLLPIENYHLMLIMAVMTGVVSTSLYNWVTELDFEELYLFLPVSSEYLMKSKLILYAYTTTFAAMTALFVAFIMLNPPLIFFLAAVVLAASVASYATSVTVYLTGMRPNSMLYSGKTFLFYIFAIVPPLLIPAVTFMTGFAGQTVSLAMAFVFALVMFPAAYVLLRLSYSKIRSQEAVSGLF